MSANDTTHGRDLVHPADRLLEAIASRRAPVCVGVDPVLERLPDELRRGTGDAAVRAVERFASGVVEAVAEHVPCVKLQSACFERYGGDGVAALGRVTKTARASGMQVVLDAKRGDIGISAEHYAAAVFGASDVERRPDWVTVNAYFGTDGIAPFLCEGFGAYALVRTSNPSADAIQDRRLEDGGSVAEAVAAMVAALGRDSIGREGYSALGAVVAATRPEAALRLRRIMPEQMLLVPGFGAQGGGIGDVLPCYHPDGRGAIVTASRSVIYAFERDASVGWQRAVERAAASFAVEVASALGLR